jgi:hypothetical protein
MNFITEMEGQEIQVELKYCERCGGLWLRLQGTEGIYCDACRMRLDAMPDPGKPRPRKARRRRTARLEERVTQIQAVQTGDQRTGQFEYPAGAAIWEVCA